jgi:hypothetical protein
MFHCGKIYSMASEEKPVRAASIWRRMYLLRKSVLDAAVREYLFKDSAR